MENYFGDFIKKHRKNKNLTLKSLSSVSGVSFVQISNLERGKCKSPSSNTILKLSKALGVDYETLFNASIKK